MSFTVDTGPALPVAEPTEAAVSVGISDEDLRRLDDLATRAGVGEPGAGSFAELLSAMLHRGIAEACDIAGSDSRRTRAQTSRRAILLAAAAATAVLIAGSYADHWTWTGFRDNGQVWDWMQLLLLPVAIGTFPLWLRFSAEMSAPRRKALGAAVLAGTVFVLAGYLVPLTWTGFRGHTLWNWLTLIVLPITVTAVAVWPKSGRSFRRAYVIAAAALGVAWIVTVIGGYAGHWGWTGYSGNTLWEWVKLFLAPIAITTFVVPELITLVAGDVGDDGLTLRSVSPVVDSPCETASRPAT
jgi:uncharacterized membrane protein